MIETTNSITKIKDLLIEKLKEPGSTSQINIKRTSLGWFNLHIISHKFEGQDDNTRETLINKILQTQNLSLTNYPFADYTLLTPTEAESSPKYTQLPFPLWSEILMTPIEDLPKREDEDIPPFFERPLIVTFYSFKGGVGRTTALTIVAGILAQNYRVVMIDLDLEAPGLSFMFPPDPAIPDAGKYGVLDYLHQRYLTPNDNFPLVADCIRPIDLGRRGELYLIPAGEYDVDYIHRLADLNMRSFYRREINPIDQLLDDIKTTLEPDIILIDARTGFDETSAVALFDMADLGILCFLPTDQSLKGLDLVVKAATKQKMLTNKPDLHFLLTPIPQIEGYTNYWLNRTEEWIISNLPLPTSAIPDEFYNSVAYNPQITVLKNLVKNVPEGILSPYRGLIEVIENNLKPVRKDGGTKIAKISDQFINQREDILNKLRFQSTTAQEMRAEDIPQIFQKTGDFPQFLDGHIKLIRGAKGTGKSLLFRLFVEQSETAKKLAISVGKDKGINEAKFIPAHGKEGLNHLILGGPAFETYEQKTERGYWDSFWLHYALLQLGYGLPNLQQNSILNDDLLNIIKSRSHQNITDWLVRRAETPLQGKDELRHIDNYLNENNIQVWLFYDELDTGFGQIESGHKRRNNALNSLLAWWLEVGGGLTNIRPKILLREDIWHDLNFTNKAHYASQSIQLKWEEADLWRLVLRQILASSQVKLVWEKGDISLNKVDNLTEDELRQSLYPLWGERMGRGNKAFTYNWVRKRIADTQNNRFPRSLILLLQEATKQEVNYRNPNPYEDTLLRPKSLVDALPAVSTERVNEVKNEYPELVTYLDKLQSAQSPITLNELKEKWGKDEKELPSLIKDMIEAGIMQEYSRKSSANYEEARYAVAELYLAGLGMWRKGPG